MLLDALPERRKYDLRTFCPVNFFNTIDDATKTQYLVVVQMNGQFHAAALVQECRASVTICRFACRHDDNANCHLQEILAFLDSEHTSKHRYVCASLAQQNAWPFPHGWEIKQNDA